MRYAALIGFLSAMACGDARPKLYTAEGLDCVRRYDSGARVKECWREVDERYDQLDGGR